MTILNVVYNLPAWTMGRLQSWAARAALRRQLRGLLRGDGQFIKDTGLSLYDISQEAWKPFWQA